MIFNVSDIPFTDEEWIYMIAQYLKGWTETPLSHTSGYDLETVKFYDGLLGTLLKQTERIADKCPTLLNRHFVNSWKYQGKLYRVLHPYLDINEDGEENWVMPEVDYHGMIGHWTDDYTFDALLYKLSPDESCIILEADTNGHFAFDVNRFRKVYQCEERYTQGEREFLFPMRKDCITEYHMSINEFIKMKQVKNSDKTHDET